MLSNTEKFVNDGVVIIPNVVSDNIIDGALEQFERLKHNNFEWLQHNDLLVKDCLVRGVNFHCLLPALRKLFSGASNEAMQVVDTIGKGTLYTSLFFERGSEQPSHRDTPYFWTNPAFSYLGFWIALEDIDEENGPLFAIPGSHKLGEPDRAAMRRSILGDAPCPPAHDGLFTAYNAWVNQRAEEAGLKPKLCCVKKGDAVIWDASTLHGGTPQKDPGRTRRSIAMHVTAKSVPVMHMQYYFHPDKPMPERAPWNYFEEDEREFASHKQISFMHKIDVPLSRFDNTFTIIPEAEERQRLVF